jgi:hypothetical protein
MADPPRTLADRLDKYPTTASIDLVSLFFIVCVLLRDAYRETNDDVAMSNFAHGYGIAADASPGLIFSNVLYGHLVSSIPSVFEVWPYSIVHWALLFASALAIPLWLPSFGVGRLRARLAVVLAFIKPVAFPQFIVLAGLLSATGFLGVLHHFETASQASLVAACLFFIFGFPVRFQSRYLVGLLAIPFLPWRPMLKSHLVHYRRF